MLTEVKAYSSWPSAPTLLLSETGRAETDLIQIRNIDGLNPVKASVNTSPWGSVDGAAYAGSSVVARNIVMTICPNPDWENWTYETLRRLLYRYFMPKSQVRLVFESDDISPVEIFGIIEGVEVNQFSKEPEQVISIICPDPYFVAVDPTIVTGQTIREGGASTPITYNGSIETGILLKVTKVSGSDPTTIGIQVGDPEKGYFWVDAGVSATDYFQMSSLARQKFIESVDMDTGVLTNLLALREEGSSWPTLVPGVNNFSVITDQGVQDWELSYYERFGGL